MTSECSFQYPKDSTHTQQPSPTQRTVHIRNNPVLQVNISWKYMWQISYDTDIYNVKAVVENSPEKGIPMRIVDTCGLNDSN